MSDLLRPGPGQSGSTGRPGIIVMAKEPVAGRVKTRLCPPCTPEEAALLAEAMLADTLATVAATSVSRRTVALDGNPGPWLPRGFGIVAQRGVGLAERLVAAFADAGAPAVAIATDTPQVTPELLELAVAALDQPGVDAVLGPTDDAGYWAIGLRRPDARVFAGVPMSSALTLAAQRDRLGELGLRFVELPPLRDVDGIDDARFVAASIPGSRFAGLLAAIGRSSAERPEGRRPPSSERPTRG